MLTSLVAWERRWRRHFDVPPTDTETWARARLYNLWFDHAVLRYFWTNELEIAPGVFRSNQPTPGRLKQLKARGVRSILSLRGGRETAHFATERAYCAELGLAFHTLGFSDKAAPTRDGLLQLIDLFRRLERPFLLHCKSGADRAGLASAVYLLAIEGRDIAEAKAMLSPRFLHFKRSKTGELDRVLEGYRRDGAGRGFEAWLRESYDPATLPPR